MAIKNYRDLVVWKKGIELFVKTYRLTSGFPKEEKYGLISQMNRAAASVSANIAEGWSRNSRESFIYFLNVSKGSLAELDTYLELSKRLFNINENHIRVIVESVVELQKMIESLKKSIRVSNQSK